MKLKWEVKRKALKVVMGMEVEYVHSNLCAGFIKVRKKMVDMITLPVVRHIPFAVNERVRVCVYRGIYV